MDAKLGRIWEKLGNSVRLLARDHAPLGNRLHRAAEAYLTQPLVEEHLEGEWLDIFRALREDMLKAESFDQRRQSAIAEQLCDLLGEISRAMWTGNPPR
ncbi:hypothetical protein [Myxococcus sp. AB036A]|uniref:hypothetical protein n=1 Tax=Myxococcus sp. AB036A TaxID=2562793 RepID=UPI0011477693|nr:hypothetical protein [Myxococcus sp. AB036A]